MTDSQPGEYWHVCADPNPKYGIVLEVERKDGVDLFTGEELYRVYLTPDHTLGTELVKRSWLRERRIDLLTWLYATEPFKQVERIDE